MHRRGHRAATPSVSTISKIHKPICRPISQPPFSPNRAKCPSAKVAFFLFYSRNDQPPRNAPWPSVRRADDPLQARETWRFRRSVGQSSERPPGTELIHCSTTDCSLKPKGVAIVTGRQLEATRLCAPAAQYPIQWEHGF